MAELIIPSNSVNKIVMNAHTVVIPFCGHGGHTAPYVRSDVIAKNAGKRVAAIVSSNSVNEVAMNAHTVGFTFCGHGGHTAPNVRIGVIAKDAIKSVEAIIPSNSVNMSRLGDFCIGGPCSKQSEDRRRTTDQALASSRVPQP